MPILDTLRMREVPCLDPTPVPHALCRGHNIGTRLIDEFLAKSKTTRCLGFRDAIDKMAKVEFNVATADKPQRMQCSTRYLPAWRTSHL